MHELKRFACLCNIISFFSHFIFPQKSKRFKLRIDVKNLLFYFIFPVKIPNTDRTPIWLNLTNPNDEQKICEICFHILFSTAPGVNINVKTD